VPIKANNFDVLNVIKLLALLLHIWEVSGSDLGPETGYPDCNFNGFPQSVHANAGTAPYIRSQLLPSTFFAIH
jgi:hypothetical protein